MLILERLSFHLFLPCQALLIGLSALLAHLLLLLEFLAVTLQLELDLVLGLALLRFLLELDCLPLLFLLHLGFLNGKFSMGMKTRR